METDEVAIKRLAETKTEEDLLGIQASLQASLVTAPPGDYYGQLFIGLIRVQKALDIKKKS